MIQTDRQIPDWVMENLGKSNESMFGIGEVRDGVIIAGAAFEKWTKNNIWGHLRVEKSPSKLFWIELGNYVFVHCGCSRFSSTVESTNEKAINLNLHMGFVIEATLKDAGESGDLLVMTLWRDKCRFLNWKK